MSKRKRETPYTVRGLSVAVALDASDRAARDLSARLRMIHRVIAVQAAINASHEEIT